VRRRDRILRIARWPLVRVLLCLVWIVICMALLASLDGVIPKSARSLVTPLLMALAVLLGYVSFTNFIEQRAPTEIVGKGALANALVGAAIGFGLFSAVMAALCLLGVYKVTGTNSLEAALPALAEAIMAGVFEVAAATKSASTLKTWP
jgi:hypothetical protein